jgi:hypothetical protein
MQKGLAALLLSSELEFVILVVLNRVGTARASKM